MEPIRPCVVHEADRPVESWPGIVSWRTLLGAPDTPSDGLTLGTAEIPAGATVDGALHRHEQAEVYLITGGEGTVHLDGTEHPVRAGSAVMIPGGTWHFVRNTGSVPLTLTYVLAAGAFSDVRYERPTS